MMLMRTDIGHLCTLTATMATRLLVAHLLAASLQSNQAPQERCISMHLSCGLHQNRKTVL